MPALFQKYKIALLDSSFFSSEFTDEVKDGLSAIRVYVANSFIAEIEQYKYVLSDKRRKAFEKNVTFLQHNMKLNTLDLNSQEVKKLKINNDTWGMISLLIGLKAKFVVITSNKILIQRIILNSLDADIFDLNDNRFIFSKDYEKLSSQYEISKAASTLLPSSGFTANENSVLFCKSGSRITLGNELGSGVEANLYRVQNNDSIVAKVFKRGKLSREKLANITDLVGMNERMGIEWAIFPQDILYYDEACKVPAGFIEKYVKTDENLDQNPLYSGDVDLTDELFRKSSRQKQSTTIELAIKIVRQVCYLNSYGYFISDYNTRNFAIIANNNKVIQMWDTDSFGFNNYFSGYCSGNLNSREYNTSKKLGAIDYCTEALYVFVFSLLSLGDPPIYENTGKFEYDNSNYPNLFRRIVFPENLWDLFAEIFHGEKVPSAETLLDQLSVAYANLTNNPKNNKTYEELLAPILLPELVPNSIKTIETSSNRIDGTDSGNAKAKADSSVLRRMAITLVIMILSAIIGGIIGWYWDELSACIGLQDASSNQLTSLLLDIPAHSQDDAWTFAPTEKPMLGLRDIPYVQI